MSQALSPVSDLHVASLESPKALSPALTVLIVT